MWSPNHNPHSFLPRYKTKIESSYTRLIRYGMVMARRTMPNKGYSSISVRTTTYQKFLAEVERVRQENAAIDNSRFLEMLLDRHRMTSNGLDQQDLTRLTRHGDFTEVANAASSLGLQKIVPQITSIYERAASDGTKAYKREYVAGASLYIACKQAGIPKTLKDIAEATGLDSNELFSHVTAVTMQLGLSISRTDPSVFVRQIAERVNSRGFKYGVSEKSIKDAVLLLERVKNLPTVAGRRPFTMAAWALYRACKANRDNVSQKSIANAANIVDASIHKIGKDLETFAQPGNGNQD